MCSKDKAQNAREVLQEIKKEEGGVFIKIQNI
ncbi:hypothetical protein PQ689_04925 [Thermoanaerobacterium thermosaccharolyticum]